ncbi:MAG TPA: GAF domain-containing protein, partial [Streptosporangiaceae bacterium]|nr:GAF domain-containing protein [Streptosporangiaceae bacterium]
MTKSVDARGDAPIESSIPVGAVPLESILCTDELHRRPSRAPDHEEENRALVNLRSALADSPGTILQTLAETILHITQCDSAGLSLLTRDGQTPDAGGERFYWPAIAGMWNPHVGGGTPRNFGPCGDVLDRNCTLLFNHFERRYPYLLPVVPAAEECLLVPFYVAGKAVGTIWAIMHSDRRKFDAEDDRVMSSLGKFASSAYQTLAFIDELRFQIGEREKAEAALHKLADGLEMQVRVRTQELERSTEEVLATNKELEQEITERQRAEHALIGAQSHLKDLADEQAALRRVATLVARGAPQAEVFAVVAREVASCLGVPLISIVRFETDGAATHVGAWGEQNPHPVGTSWRLDEYGASGIVSRSGRSARVDYEHVPGPIAAKLAHEAGIRSAVAVPIVVGGRLWGTMMALSTAATPQAATTEDRLASFTELVATALANAEAGEELQQLADEQAALREVATLVARGAEPQDVFEAVAEVTGRLIGAASVNLARFTADGHNLTISGWSKRGTHVPSGTRLPLAGESINAIVWQTQAPGRVDSYEGLSGPLAARLRELGIKSEVGAPVIVDGSLWGALYAGKDHPEPLPPGAEWRLASFAELIATAIANAEARRQLQQMADEQAALRQVATLVARGAEPPAVFDAVCEVTGQLMDAAIVNLSHYTSDGFSVTMAGWSQRGNHVPPGTRLPLDGPGVGALVKQTRAPSRVDNYDSVSGQHGARVREFGIRSGVGAPVIVDGSVWGVLIAGTDQPEPLPAGTEQR